MIQSPKSLTEQLLNLCERIAVEMRALFNTVDTKLGKTEKAVSAKTADTATTSVTATKATQDASGNIITSTYATKTELAKKLDTSSAFTRATADTLYLGKTAKAASAATADTATSATKASQDATGNDIPTTYATKTEVTKGLAGKANASHTHTASQITDLTTILAPYAKTTDVNSTLSAKADTTTVNAGLAKKLDITTFNGYIDYGDLGS